MKIRVKICRKTKEEAAGRPDDEITASPRKSRKNVALHEIKISKLHDSLTSETFHSSFNSSVRSSQFLYDSLNFQEDASFVSARGRCSFSPCKEKVKFDLERLLSKKKVSKPTDESGSSQHGALKEQEKNQDPLPEVKDRKSRARARARSGSSDRGRGRTPNDRDVGKCTSSTPTTACTRRQVPRRSKSLGFRTSDEIIQAYEDIQNKEIEEAERMDRNRDISRRRATISHEPSAVDRCHEQSCMPLSQSSATWTGRRKGKSVEELAPLQRSPPSKRSGMVASDDLLQAYERMVNDFDSQEQHRMKL